jgi:hypothetical protein
MKNLIFLVLLLAGLSVSAQDFGNISVQPGPKISYHSRYYTNIKVNTPAGTLVNISVQDIKGCLVKSANGVSAITIEYDGKEIGSHVLEIPIGNIYYIDADNNSKTITIIMH